jgi:hypothetical protein
MPEALSVGAVFPIATPSGKMLVTPWCLSERPLWVEKGHSGEGSSRYVVVNAKVLLDSADALQEVIDFFREARDVPGSDFKCVEPKTDVFNLTKSH